MLAFFAEKHTLQSSYSLQLQQKLHDQRSSDPQSGGSNISADLPVHVAEIQLTPPQVQPPIRACRRLDYSNNNINNLVEIIRPGAPSESTTNMGRPKRKAAPHNLNELYLAKKMWK
ncbi:hypothetical protein DMENIID0001_009600 [Sergentomyia squamirostris]